MLILGNSILFKNFNHSDGCVVVFHCGYNLHVSDD